MAGVSLTLFWLDDELERLWAAPGRHPGISAAAPSHPRASSRDAIGGRSRRVVADPARDRRLPRRRRGRRRRVIAAIVARSTSTSTSSAGSTRSPATATTASACSAARTPRATPRARRSPPAPAPARVLERAADAWSDKAGGTSGALWGVVLRAIAGAARRRRRARRGIRRRRRRRPPPTASALRQGRDRRQDHGRRARAVQRDPRRARSTPARPSRDAWRTAADDASRGRRGHRRPPPAHGPRPDARREEPRHARSRRALARPHRAPPSPTCSSSATAPQRTDHAHERPLRIVVGSDDAGFDYKEILKARPRAARPASRRSSTSAWTPTATPPTRRSRSPPPSSSPRARPTAPCSSAARAWASRSRRTRCPASAP